MARYLILKNTLILDTQHLNTSIINRLFWTFAALVIICAGGAIWLEEKLLLALPFIALIGFQTVMDFRPLYYFLFVAIPISTEVYFSDSLATDLPDEPLIAGLSLIYLLTLLSKPQQLSGAWFRHPITLLLFLHLGWILVATIFSQQIGTSIKFFIAKIWYVFTFYFLTEYILKDESHWRRVFWCVAIPFALATFKVLAHHALLNFGFKEINAAVTPFFRNHVNYAAMLALFIPWVWFMRHEYARWSFRWWLIIGMLALFLAGVMFSYTRAAYLALVLAMGAYWVVRLRLMRWALGVSVVAMLAGVTYMVQGNKFMDFVPSERTVAHEEFGDIVGATTKLEDVSTMERYYRWIAGMRMAQEDVWTGYGPSNFQTFYKQYTLSRFSTYVSDNPERSGIHNYFLMTYVEQGLPGLIIFAIFILYVFLYAERVYHQSTSPSRRRTVMAILLSLVVITAFLLINDLVETDKVGSFFFFNIAVLVLLDLRNREQIAAPANIS